MTRNTKTILAVLFLVALVMALFYPVKGYDFLNMDDPFFIQRHHVPEGLTLENIQRAFSLHDCIWMPLTWLSHMTDYQLYGPRPAGHHLTSLILHIFNVLLLFFVLRSLTGAFYRSWLVAAVFALHPLNVEPVAYIACRKGLLAAFFWLLAISAYTGYVRRKTAGRYLLTVICFFLGMMAKPMPVTLPLIFLLLDYWPLNRFQKEAPLPVFKEKLPLLVLSLIIGIVAIITQQQADALPTLSAIPFIDRIGNALISYMTYLGRLFWPSGLAVFYPWPPDINWANAGASVLLLVLISLLVIIRRKKMPYAVSGWFWFIIALLPVIGIIPLGGHAMADRYAYIPGIGIMLAVVWSLAEMFRHRPVKKVLTVLLVLIILTTLGLFSRRQLGHWQNSETIFRQALSVTTDNYAAHNNLARALVEKGRIEEARPHLDRALTIHPEFPQAHNNLGVILAAEGRTEAALAHFSQAVEYQPDFAKAHYNMANVLLSRGALDSALANFQRVLDIEPDYHHAAIVYYRIGLIMNAGRHFEKAAEKFKQALSIDPAYIEAAYKLAAIYKNNSQYDEAVNVYEQLLEQRPDCDISITYNLACLYALKNDPEKTIAWLRQCIAAGFSHYDLLHSDPDLADIRQTPLFNTFIDTITHLPES